MWSCVPAIRSVQFFDVRRDGGSSRSVALVASLGEISVIPVLHALSVAEYAHAP